MHLRGGRHQLLRVGESNRASVEQVVSSLHAGAIGALQANRRRGRHVGIWHRHLHSSPQL